MADLTRSIEIIFGAVDNTAGVINGISSNINNSFDGISNLTKPLSDIATSAIKTETAILAVGTAMLSVAVNESAKLATSINEIGTLFNATPAQVDKMKASIQAYGADSVFTFKDITKATYDMVSATGDAEGAVGALSSAEQLAVVGGTDLSTATNALTTIINAYGLDLGKSTEVTGAFFTAVQNGKTTLPELEASIGRVAASAAASGVPFDDLLASIAALTGGGINTTEAMTGMTAILSEMAKPTDALKTALGGMTLETDDLQSVMKKLQEETGGSFSEMSNLFGSVEATKSALVLGADAAGTFNKTIEAMGDKTSVVSKNFGLMSGNLDLATQNMQNNLTISLQNIGDELLPGWSGIVASIGDVFKGVNISLDDGAFNDVFKALQDFETAISVYLSGIAKALPEALNGVDFSSFIDSFGEIGDSINGIFDDLDFTDAKDLEKAIQFVVDGFTSLNIVVSGIVEAWQPALQTIAKFVDEFGQLDTDTQKTVGNLGGYAQVFETFKGAILGGATALETIGTALSVLAGVSALPSITAAISILTGPAGLVVAAGLAGASLRALLNEEYNDTATAKFEGLYDALEKLSSIDTSGFSEQIHAIINSDNAGDGTKQALADIVKEISNLSNANSSEIVKDVRGILENNAAGDSTAKALNDIIKGFSGLSTELVTAGKGASNTAITFADLEEKLKTTGLNTEEANKYFGLLEDSVASTDKATFSAVESMEKYGTTSGRSKKQIEYIIDSIYGAGDAYHDTDVNATNAADSLSDYGNAADASTKQIKKVEEATKGLSESQKIEITHSNEMEKTLLSLASNQKIKAMEFTASINIAQIEADAQRAVAAYEGLADGITSANDLVSKLFSHEAPSWDYFGFATQDAIEKGQDQAEKMTNSIVARNNAEIANLNARTQSLNNGGSEININAGNLAPELQVVLRSLIDNIRIEAVNNGLEILR